jgi:pSer/pThr/pTyr-binding forkhead associated (FHA) protein
MKIIKIGRSSSNDVVISDSTVSGTHCQIIKDDSGKFRIIDTNSANGTYINGVRRHGEASLNQSDIVRIGNTTLPWQAYFNNAVDAKKDMTMKVITIGRSSQNDVVISDSKVSRHHLQIIQDDYGNFRLADFGSKNGTFVNGTKISGEITLSSNDVVRIGNTTVAWKQYFPPSLPPQISPEPTTSAKNLGVLVLLLGLASIGLIAFIIINYFTSFGNQLAVTFGGMEFSIKLFPLYLRGYFGIGGQWVFMIAALVLGIIADFVAGVVKSEEDKLSTAGTYMANIGITIAIIFLLLAIFATKIVELY